MVQISSEREPAEKKRRRGRPRAFDPDAALDRARSVFWNKGYAATSLDDLTEATGLARPSLYGAFGDKRALYLATLERSRTESVGRLVEALSRDAPLAEVLDFVFATAAATYVEGEAGQRGCFLIGTAVTEAVDGADARQILARALGEMDAAFLEHFRRAAEAGEFAKHADLPGLARLATATLNAMAVRARAGADEEALRALGRSFTVLLPRSAAP